MVLALLSVHVKIWKKFKHFSGIVRKDWFAYLVLIISVMLCDCYVKHMVPVSMNISYLYSNHMLVSSFISEHSAISRKLKNKWNGRKWNILIIIFQYHFNITLSNSKHTVNAVCDCLCIFYCRIVIEVWEVRFIEIWVRFSHMNNKFESILINFSFQLILSLSFYYIIIEFTSLPFYIMRTL